MRFRIAVVFLFTILLLPSFANAGGDRGMRFGLMPMYSRFDVHDPDGATESATSTTPFSGIVIFESGRDGRVFVHGYSAQVELPASTTDIGQKLKQAGLNASYQTMVRITRNIKPWVGIGLGYASERYQGRYTVTSAGHLGQSYPARTLENYTAVVNASHEWQYNRNFDIGLHVQLEQPTSSDGARSMRFGFYVVY